ncbi:UDP-N-acetylmuramate dehydrogenase [Aggregatilinea lenta]|uniref:UDP-N-acetylmuramate dehydrogenase n=1 Tax=Aggregatilinea lenta TaxID=913108 RepID=UPI000E5ACCBE|nr:UDP-N-acetylmuramate dehydrogenase [Aggregatilinea lenta]
MMPTHLSKQLRANLRGEFRENEDLSRHTTWRIGGPAELFIVPSCTEDIEYALSIAHNHQIPVFVLGRGSNVLIADAGLPGITLCLAKSLQDVEIKQGILYAGSGVALPRLARITARHGYSGFEFLVGIPGTVGGGVLINAGTGNGQIADVLETITYIDQLGDLHTKHYSELEFGYRRSALLQQPIVVIGAQFRLEHCEARAKIEANLREILRQRRQKFPLNLPNAGSVFKRPLGYPPAGRLIEEAGLKGFRIGDAQVSEVHANFITNLGHATSNDVKELILLIRERVYQIHGVALEREIVLLPGEDNGKMK